MKKKFKRKNQSNNKMRKRKSVNYMLKQKYVDDIQCIDIINFMDKTIYVLLYNDDKNINGILTRNKKINKKIHIKGEFILIHRRLYEETTETYMKYIIGHELGHIFFRKKFIEDCLFHMILKRRIGIEVLCDLFSFKYYNLDIDTIEREIQTTVKKIYKEDNNEEAIKEMSKRIRMCKRLQHSDLNNIYNDYKRFLTSSYEKMKFLRSIDKNSKKYLEDFNKTYNRNLRNVFGRRKLMKEKLELLNKNIGGK